MAAAPRVRGRPAAALWLAASLGGCALLQPSRNAHVPAPAKSVDLSRYLGTWYEFARYDSSFEHDCDRTTATYTQRPDGLVGVVNQCRADSDGHLEIARGRAKVVADSGNAKLKVSFFGPFFVGSYWVLDHGDDYSWAIVGEPTGGYLWILTRQARPSASERTALTARVAALGYDVRMLHFTTQE